LTIAEQVNDPLAEELVLGECLLKGSIEPLGDLVPEQFWNPTYRLVCKALRELLREGKPLHTVQVQQWAEAHGQRIDWVNLFMAGDKQALFKPGQLAYYQTRIAESARKRAALKDAGDLAQELQGAVSVEEVRERAKQILEKTEPAAPAAKPAEKEVEYPPMPKAAWYGATEIYRQAMERTAACSDNYHLAGFLTVVGSVLGKTICVPDGEEDLYPNLFLVVVGEAGWAKKDSALRAAMRFIKRVEPTFFSTYKVSSVEGFIDELAAEQNDLAQKGFDRTPLRVLLKLSELRNLIAKASNKGSGDLIPTICEAFDCPEQLKTPVRTKPAHVDEPILSVYACTNPRWLRHVSVEDLEAGFGSRTMFAPGDPKPLWPRRHPPRAEFLVPLVELVKERVAKFRREPRRFQFSGAAEKAWDDWVVPHDALRSDDATINLMAARDPQICMKVALIHAALDDAAGIELQHFDAARAFVEWLYESRFPMFAGHGMTPTAEIEKKIIERVTKAMPLGLSWRDIRRSVAQRIDRKMFEERMKYLIQGVDPPLTLRKIGKRAWVVLND
jgi:hypothetical protein